MLRTFLNLCAVIFAIGLMSALSGCGPNSGNHPDQLIAIERTDP